MESFDTHDPGAFDRLAVNPLSDMRMTDAITIPSSAEMVPILVLAGDIVPSPGLAPERHTHDYRVAYVDLRNVLSSDANKESQYGVVRTSAVGKVPLTPGEGETYFCAISKSRSPRHNVTGRLRDGTLPAGS